MFNIKKVLVMALVCAPIAVFTSVAYAADVNTSVIVDETKIIKLSDKRLLGFNVEFADFNLGKGTSSSNAQLYYGAKKYGIEIPMVRGFFNTFDWKATIDDVNQRGHNEFSVPYAYGMVEWIRDVQSLTPDAEFTIVIKADDTVENIQDMVRFLTLNPNDPNAVSAEGINWAQKRIDLGIFNPVPISCFEIGNEMDMKYNGSDAAINDFANTYISWCKLLIQGIQAVNSNAKTCVFVYTTPQDNTGRWRIWNEKIITQLGPLTDYIAYHYYYHSTNNLASGFKTYFDEGIASYIEKLPVVQRPKIFMSEHAVWADPSLSKDDYRKVAPTALRGALTSAEAVNRASNRTDIELMVYHCLFGRWSTSDDFGGNCWGVMRPYYSGELLLTGVGEYFKMIYNAFGETIVQVECSGNEYVDNTKQERMLTASSHAREDGMLTLIFSNQNPEVGHNISFSAVNSYKLEKEQILTDGNVWTENMPSDPDVLFAKTNSINATENFERYYVPPQSIVVLYLAPIDKVYDDTSDMAVTIEEIASGRYAVDCTLYSNKAMSGTDKLSLLVLKQDVDINSLTSSDIVYIDAQDTTRERAYFEFSMPENAESGRYKVLLANKAYNAASFGIAEFDHVKVGTIECISIVNNPNSEYSVDFVIEFSSAILSGTRLDIEIINTATNDIVFIEEAVVSGKTYEFTAYMPRDAISGSYMLRASCLGDFRTEVFEFLKPYEIIRILNKPANSNDEAYTFSDLSQDGQIFLRLQNISESPVSVEPFAAIYDIGGEIIAVAKGNKIEIRASESDNWHIDVTGIPDESEIGGVKIFIWDGASIIPYTNYYIIKE